MSERDLFEHRLRAAVRRYSEEVTSGLDPLAFAHVVATTEPRGRVRWLIPRALRPSTVRSAGWVLLTLALVLALVAGAIVWGAFRPLPVPQGLVRPGLIVFDGGGTIWVANPDESDVRPFGSPSDGAAATWSPDGTALAFWRADRGHWSLVIASPGGSVTTTVPTQAVAPADHPYVGNPGMPSPVDWAPDSRHFAFSMPPTDGVAQIWTGARDGTDLRAIGDATLPATDPEWSSDGTQLAFHGGCGAPGYQDGVYVMNPDGSGARPISTFVDWGIMGPDPDSSHANRSFHGPRWQPGGDLVAYAAGAALGYWPGSAVATDSYWVLIADGRGGEHDMSPAHVDDEWASWSPDGTRLAFVRMAMGETTGRLVVVAPDGTLLATPAQPVGLGTPEWSADGRKIIAHLTNAFGTPYGFVIVDLAEAEPAVTVRTTGTTTAISWQRLAP